MPRQSSHTQKFVSTTRTTTTITTTPTSIKTTTKTTQVLSANYGKNGNQKLIGAGSNDGSSNGWSECPQGSVPSGAVIGGQRDGKNLYIVRVSYAGGYYPSGAFSQNDGVWFGYGGRTIKGNTFQCLTSKTPFRWISVSGPCTSDKVGTNVVVQGG